MNLVIDGTVVAVGVDGTDIEPRLSPRPYLHPVRTLGGTTVTEVLPADHRHHLGVGVAVPDVSGVSFWGGRTFTPDRGSVLLDNHGRQRRLSWRGDGGGGGVEELSWTGPDGGELVREERRLRARPLDGAVWVLDLDTALRNTSGRDLDIGSPATNGRPGAGYGGLFWRAPIGPVAPRVHGPGGLEGEAALHGSRAAWSALVGDAGGPWTLLFHQPGGHTDPWFVRAGEYPGVGPALAWDVRLPVPVGAVLRRRLRVAVCDGHVGDLAGLAAAVVALP
ncbi:DUF6807 domain-containing protein [Nocardiopsis lambiniae]|uniref:PmoA family protein n=1 Tax=Nocardiopsis lambiniae TaxID=3075539 RepID=A0ABU2MCG9_9ACTN|nr:PmoA family protein [Nocardiopsis sp. DSM 44743]MDT0330267.1 PmoA family protein [Nocardiopsis sp. DSM 44743]